MSEVLERLRGGLIVSCQAKRGSALDNPAIIAALAHVAQENGAAGVRIEGIENLRMARGRVSVPIIGLIKRTYEGFEPYITPTLAEANAILETGAEIVAFDATGRTRPAGEDLAVLIEGVHRGGALAMADCATASEARSAFALGSDILATTLCGYTKETAGAPLPALDMVRDLRGAGGFVICEGGIHAPGAGRAALDAGADAVVVGTAITNVGWLVAQYAAALRA